MLKLKIEKVFQYLKMNFGTFMRKLNPKFYKVELNAFRRINVINNKLFEKDAVTYSCNICGGVVFKGSIKYGIVLNCPNCGCVYSVAPKFPHKFKKMELIRAASSRKDKVDENSELLRLL